MCIIPLKLHKSYLHSYTSCGVYKVCYILYWVCNCAYRVCKCICLFSSVMCNSILGRTIAVLSLITATQAPQTRNKFYISCCTTLFSGFCCNLTMTVETTFFFSWPSRLRFIQIFTFSNLEGEIACSRQSPLLSNILLQ